MGFKSSELVQKTVRKRLALKPQDLPAAADFTSAGASIIQTQWVDGSGQHQLVFSSYNGTSVNHWVSVGVNSATGNLDAWVSGGTYEQVLKASDVDSDSFTVTSRVLTLKSATSSELGGIKIGGTLQIDGSGVVNVAISPTAIKIVADQAARIAIPQSTGAQIAIQQDTGETWGIEANQDPSIPANWKQIGTVATSVVSFNGRSGGVNPEFDDYQADMVPATDASDGKKYVFAVQNGVPGIVEV
ncbi:MAG: hypothetical protein Tp138OMZ00d2C19078241_18 [Prokaryotic dsDNA virus sp.]|jgi:hypothetical protein|nr:MAG: hypothetical protein Tp138OMZ00d2C19078241_18 [Prokaryotic dsDNA virus sp.]|tara:strand:- start:31359 stop:32090 length:732 start_codon:yes stop_codon:yes gene_type:complete